MRAFFLLCCWLCCGVAWSEEVQLRFHTRPEGAQVRLASSVYGKKLLGQSGQTLFLQAHWLQEPLLTFEFQMPGRQTVVEQIPRSEVLKGGDWPREGALELLPDQNRIARVVFRTEPAGARILQHNSGKEPAFIGLTGKPVTVQVDLTSKGTQFTFEMEGYDPLPQTILTSRLQDGMMWPPRGRLQLTPNSRWVAARTFFLKDQGLALRLTLIFLILFGTVLAWLLRRDRSLRRAVQRIEADYQQHQNGTGPFLTANATVRDLAALGYTVEGELGRGGMSVVYDVVKTGDPHHLALKLLNKETSQDTDAIRRMRREIKILRELHHPSIVPLYDFGELNGHYYLVMEKVDGESLRQRLERGSLTCQEALSICLALTEGMAYAHERGVIHRDLKPENVMLRSDGRVQILDFGISRSTTSNTFVTMDDTVLGTPIYMAPERFAGEADQSSDQYALGLMFYELLTGQHPVGLNADIAMILHKQLYEKPRPLRDLRPEIPAEAEFAVMTMLEKSPSNRFPTLEVALKELRKALPGNSDWLTPAAGCAPEAG